ncbi:MAG TPA: 4-(cytidine 5'-diphospho)-2-C-methyl-D-erythritol kinase [Gemmatimonadota bacterium]|nr:4-(cytidine 5'-diphospho)-2-C-methyl-D-erythritol kinase [Gemmatimonadota bacterium]
MSPSAPAPVREAWRAPAKINLWLEILGRRSDGYHEIDTCFQAIDLADTVVLEPSQRPGVSCRAEGPFAEGVPSGPDNLVVRAAVLLAERTGHEPRVAITILKAIPAGAGLGGGSSDAAAVLIALAHRFAVPDPDDTLVELAAELGADVPFFLKGGTQRATGIGDRLRPVAPPAERWGILVWPGVAVSTTMAYAMLAEGTSDRRPALGDTDAPDSDWRKRRNVFEPLVFDRYPRIAEAAEVLRDGAGFVRLAGSGGAVFALYPSGTDRDARLQDVREAVRSWSGARCWPFGLCRQGAAPEEEQ